MGTPCTSGNWTVKPGSEEAFIEAWKEFADWTKKEIEGDFHAVLLRDQQEKNKFVSVGTWPSNDAINSWRNHADFPQMIGKPKSLCAEFVAHDCDQVVEIG